MPVREKHPMRAARGQQVPLSGLRQADAPGENRVSTPAATEGTGETDSAAEGTRFEPSVPIATVSLHSRGGKGAAGRSRACKKLYQPVIRQVF